MKNIIEKVLQLLQNRLALSAGSALAFSIFCLINARKTQSFQMVDFSYMCLALKSKIVQEVVYDGVNAFFRCYNQNVWHQVIVKPMLVGKEFFKLLVEADVPIFRNICDKIFTERQVYWLVMSCATFSYSFGIMANQFLTKSVGNRNMIAGQTGVRFSNIYGLENAKKQLNQIIDYLKEPLKYKNVGARLRRGIMIYGPPGTGKTMLAKATATESNVRFLYCSATEFMEIYVGTGPKRVRELFAKARSVAPAIIFIDEIDSVAYKRKNINFGNDTINDNERVNTLNQLLTELDGFKENDNIVVIAATNRIQIIDDALMRSGRFDIKIQINLPTQEDRAGILKVHLQNKKHSISDHSIHEVAAKSENFSGADMENITNESAYGAIEKQLLEITDLEFKEGFDKVFYEKQRVQEQ